MTKARDMKMKKRMKKKMTKAKGEFATFWPISEYFFFRALQGQMFEKEERL